ncbi:MAG: CAP domain-containing protein [Bdellovibrionota bacterium]
MDSNLQKTKKVPPTRTVASELTGITTDTTGCGQMNLVSCSIFKAINSQRVLNGLSELKPLSNCIQLAQSHAEDMALNNFFSHTSPTLGTFAIRVGTFALGGYTGENIASGYTTIDGLVAGWMNSTGHRANILNSVYNSTGVGYAKDASGRSLYVQCFNSGSGDQ